jgi:hypothetical protein
LSLISEAEAGSIKIRATHEVVAARALKLAFLVDQLMTTAGTPMPVFAGVFGIFLRLVGRRCTSILVIRIHRPGNPTRSHSSLPPI